MTDKEKYMKHCQDGAPVPVFSQYWWLDTMAGPDNWDVAFVEKDSRIIASWPYYMQKVSLFNTIQMPLLTQNMGPWMDCPEGQKKSSLLSYENEIISQLLEKLPKVAWFRQTFHYSFTNWLPLYWRGYKQTTGYTYVLDDVSDLDAVFKNFKQNIRRAIRKAEKSLTVKESNDVELLYALIQKTFSRQNQQVPYSLKTLQRLYNTLYDKKKCKLLIAQDSENTIHSGHLYIWDTISSYYLLGGSDARYRNSGSASLLMWEGIKLAARMGLSFDFEGSMIQPIARFFSAFGGEAKPYFKIEKIDSRIIRFKRSLK